MHHLRNSPKITCTPCQSSPKAIDHVPAGLSDGWELIGQSNHNHISPRANQVPSPVMQVPARYSAVEHTCVLPFLITQLRHAPCPACPTICLLNRAATHPFVKDGSSCHISDRHQCQHKCHIQTTLAVQRPTLTPGSNIISRISCLCPPPSPPRPQRAARHKNSTCVHGHAERPTQAVQHHAALANEHAPCSLRAQSTVYPG